MCLLFGAFFCGRSIVNPGAAGSLVQPTYAVAVLEEGGAVCYLSHI